MKRKRRVLLIYVLVGGFLLAYLLYKICYAWYSSLFFSRPTRLNVLTYGPQTTYYSFDLEADQNYKVEFDPEVKVDVPGGYGQYRVGSLGKLALLEKNPFIFQKAFSTTTTSFVHYFYYQKSPEIYYDSSTHDIRPSLKYLLTSSSNASILDRIYLLFLVRSANENTKQIIFQKERNDALRDTFLKEDMFIRNSKGLLYSSTYRKERKSVQVIYHENYKTAESLSTLLEGNGIRVNDINKDEDAKTCQIITNEKKQSSTAMMLSHFFDCPIRTGKTDVYDILFMLGEKEEEWRIL